MDDLTVGTLIRHGFGLDLKLYSTISFDFGDVLNQAKHRNEIQMKWCKDCFFEEIAKNLSLAQ